MSRLGSQQIAREQESSRLTKRGQSLGFLYHLLQVVDDAPLREEHERDREEESESEQVPVVRLDGRILPRRSATGTGKRKGN